MVGSFSLVSKRLLLIVIYRWGNFVNHKFGMYINLSAIVPCLKMQIKLYSLNYPGTNIKIPWNSKLNLFSDWRDPYTQTYKTPLNWFAMCVCLSTVWATHTQIHTNTHTRSQEYQKLRYLSFVEHQDFSILFQSINGYEELK